MQDQMPQVECNGLHELARFKYGQSLVNIFQDIISQYACMYAIIMTQVKVF